MRRFESAKQAQRFLSAFGPICGYFQPRRHRLRAQEYRATLQDRFQKWAEAQGQRTQALDVARTIRALLADLDNRVYRQEVDDWYASLPV